MPGTVREPVKWPDTLTNTDWQKKKGALAKMAGTTDIGATIRPWGQTYPSVGSSVRGVRPIFKFLPCIPTTCSLQSRGCHDGCAFNILTPSTT
jgi:hypothetical protein